MAMTEIDVTRDELPVLHFELHKRLPEGSLVRISASGTAMLRGVEIMSARCGGRELSEVHRYSRAEMQQDWMWYIRTMSMAMFRVSRTLEKGEIVEVEARRAKSHGKQAADAPKERPISLDPTRYSGLSWTMELRSVESERSVEAKGVAEPVTIQFVAGSARRLEAYLKPDGRVLASRFDQYGNPTSGSGDETELRHRDRRTAFETAGARTQAIVSPAEIDGTDRLTVTGTAGLEARTNVLPVSLDGTPIYFGEFHWHTDFSGDGQRRTADALRSARDELGLDFAGPSDHMGASGRYGKLGPKEQAELCLPFDEPGVFCTIAGAELSRRYGHTNIYTDTFDRLIEITERFPKELEHVWGKDPDRYGLSALLKVCDPGHTLVIPHHTNMDSFVREGVVRDDGRPFWCAMHFPIPADREVVRLIEIVQGRGAFETEEKDEDWRVWDGGLGASVRTALMRGYRLGFTGGTDNHCGWPSRHGAIYAGLTCVQAPRLDTGAVFAALLARRCYATSGARIVADATLNGSPIGSELRLAPGDERKLRIAIHGTAPLLSVQIVHAGYVLADLPVRSGQLDFEGEWTDERPGRPLEDAYYYVRARQADGHCAWLSPFWVDLAD